MAVVTDKCKVDANLVLMAIGVRPNVEPAREAGLEIGETGAIKVNEHLQTSDPDVYAGGDCVENINRLTAAFPHQKRSLKRCNHHSG